jgi:hypothetical protein
LVSPPAQAHRSPQPAAFACRPAQLPARLIRLTRSVSD